MAKIFSPPANFRKPEIGGNMNVKKYFKACDAYIKKIQAWARKNSPETANKLVGTVISEPVADGKAQYVVFSLSPAQLIHIDTGDAYRSRLLEKMNGKQLREEIPEQKRVDEFWKKAAQAQAQGV